MIIRYLEKLLTWRNKKPQHRVVGSVNFSLLDNYSIDINVDLPDMSTSTPENIAILAERYAEFLLSINQGFHKNDIVGILQSKIDQNNNQQYLFIDNIISFWGLLYEQYRKNKKNYTENNQPVVKPSQVFKI